MSMRTAQAIRLNILTLTAITLLLGACSGQTYQDALSYYEINAPANADAGKKTDSIDPVISNVSPVSGSYHNNRLVSYTLSETCASGTVTFTRTSGTADPASPHIQNLTGSELTSGTKTNITLTNNPDLVDGAIYSLSWACTDEAGNTASVETSTNVHYDTSAPVISAVSPASNAAINNTLVSYTFSEICASASITFSRSGGSADAGSPHVQALTGPELNAGTSSGIAITNSPTLVNGAQYDISWNCSDRAGNVAAMVTSTAVTFSDAPLQVVNATTIDRNNNGKIDAYRLTFNKAVQDSTFPGYAENAEGGATTDWLIAGYTNVRLLHGTSLTGSSTDTADDSILYIGFNESLTTCSVSDQSGCDTGAKPDLTTTASPGLKDFAGINLSQIGTINVTEADGADPVLIAARSLGPNIVDAIFSENIEQTEAEKIANYSINNGMLVSAASRNVSNPKIVNLTTSAQTGGTTYTLTASTDVKDLANINLSSDANTAIFTGLVRPVVASIVTASTTTLTLTFNEGIVASTAECTSLSTCASIYENTSLPVLSAVSVAGSGVNDDQFTLTVNPMIEGQAYTTIVKENTAQSVASGLRIGSTNNSATFNGDGRPSASIASDTASECPTPTNLPPAATAATRVVVQYDQTVSATALTASNYTINSCYDASQPCASGTGSPNNFGASVVTSMGGNKYAVDFSDTFDTDNSQYVMSVQNVADTNGNVIGSATNLTFRCGDDQTPPILISADVVSSNNAATVVSLIFSEAVDNVIGNASGNYKYDGNAYGFNVNSAARQSNPAQVLLTFAPGLPDGGHQIRVQNLLDLATTPNSILDNGISNVQPIIVNAPSGFSGGTVFDDPFGDGTEAGFTAIYDNKFYIGADSTGAKLFELDFSMTNSQTITLDSDGNAGLPTTGFGSTNSPINITGVNSATGVDFLYGVCVGRDVEKTLTGSACTGTTGSDGNNATEFLMIGTRNIPGNFDDLFFTENRSSTTTTFTFDHLSGLESAGNTYRLGSMHLFKEYIYISNGDKGSGGPPYLSRVCMNKNGCTGGTSFLNVVRLNGSRITRLGKSSHHDNSNSEGAQKYANIDALYEYDADGASGASCNGSTNCESQLYMASGGWCTGCNLNAPRTGTSAPTVGDGGIVRTTLHFSTNGNPPPRCSNASVCDSDDPYSTTEYYDDVTPASHAKWYNYISIPPPADPAVEWQEMRPVNMPLPSTWAIPYMRTAPNGDLYVVRNACSTTTLQQGTTFRDNGRQVCPPGNEVVQLWMMKSCASASSCPPGPSDWVLVAEAGTSGQTNMSGNTGVCGTSPNLCLKNTHLTLLEFVGNYLYIGFDNVEHGANLWRTDMSAIPSGSTPTESSFNVVNGMALDGSSENQRIFSHITVNDSGKNWLVVATRDGTNAMKIYRTANDED